MNASDLSDIPKLIQSLGRLELITYTYLSSAIVLMYDFVISFEAEVDLIWSAPWTVGKCLYFLTRYPALFDTWVALYHQVGRHLSKGTCATVWGTSGWLMVVSGITAEVILAIRVWALWGSTRRILIFLSIVSVTFVGVAIITITKFHEIQRFIEMDAIAPHLSGCFPVGGSVFLSTPYMLLAAYEAMIFGMTVYKGLQNGLTNSSPFIQLFMTDGLIFFFFCFSRNTFLCTTCNLKNNFAGISLANVIAINIPSNSYVNLRTLISPQRALHSVLSARMLLHLRRASLGTQFLTLDRSEMIFANAVVLPRGGVWNKQERSKTGNAIGEL